MLFVVSSQWYHNNAPGIYLWYFHSFAHDAVEGSAVLGAVVISVNMTVVYSACRIHILVVVILRSSLPCIMWYDMVQYFITSAIRRPFRKICEPCPVRAI